MNISINFRNVEYKILKIKNEQKNEVFNLLKNNFNHLKDVYLKDSLLISQAEFEKFVLKTKNYSIITKNNKIIGVIYLMKWGNFFSVSFWIDAPNQNTNLFVQILSLYLKVVTEEFDISLLFIQISNKAIVAKKIMKKIEMKLAFKINEKISEFDNKKMIVYSVYFKNINNLYSNELSVVKMDQNFNSELNEFCCDLLDYSFKKNNFYTQIKSKIYYWSGVDVNDDLKEIYFVNLSKSKSIVKKIFKKINMIDEYKELYDQAKIIFIVFHVENNNYSLLFKSDQVLNKWLHFKEQWL